MHEVPRRGDIIPVRGKDGIEDRLVQTIDLAGYPVIGEERHDDAKTERFHRSVIANRLSRAAEVQLTIEEELEQMLDMGGIGAPLARTA